MDPGELRGAVARAIEDCHVPATGAPRYAEYYAAVAIRVVLAEAQRSIEALRAGHDDCEHGCWAPRDAVYGEALVVLAALGDETLDAPPPV